MPADAPDSQDATPLLSGDSRVWGTITDLLIIKEMSIDTQPDSVMAYTPDGVKEFDGPPIPESPEDAGARVVSRATRAAINLDKGWIITSYRDPSRPTPFSRAKEYNARTGKAGDSGMNPSEMGAVGNLNDVFRISVAENFPKGSPFAPTVGEGGVTAKDLYDINYSYNDMFGIGEESDTIRFGRLEMRIGAHFYQRNRRSGPLSFTNTQWPRDEDPETSTTALPGGIPRGYDLDYRTVESHFEKTLSTDPADDFDIGSEDTSKPGLAGQVLVGGLMFDPFFHGWGMGVSLGRRPNCNVTNDALALGTFTEFFGLFGTEFLPDPATIEDRTAFFSFPKCPGTPPEGTDWSCEATSATSYITCKEIGEQGIQDRFVTLADRLNSLLNEVDRMYCIMKTLDFNLEKVIDFLKSTDSNVSSSSTFAEFKGKQALIALIASKSCK